MTEFEPPFDLAAEFQDGERVGLVAMEDAFAMLEAEGSRVAGMTRRQFERDRELLEEDPNAYFEKVARITRICNAFDKAYKKEEE